MAKTETWSGAFYFEAREALRVLRPPPVVWFSQHPFPETDILAPDAAHALGKAVFEALRGAAASMGLVDVGVPNFNPNNDPPPKVFPRRKKNRPEPVFLWGPEVEKIIDDNLTHPPRCSCGGFPVHVVAWADAHRMNYIFVATDWDATTPEGCVAWGPDAERAIAAIDAALDDDALWGLA